MSGSVLTQSRRATKAGIRHDLAVLRGLVPSCESSEEGSDCGWVDLVEWTPSENPPVAALAEGLDTNLDVITYGDADWALSYVLPYYGGDCTRSGQIGHEKFSEMQITVGGEGTLTFWWWVYSESNDALSFRVDGVEPCDPISGYVEWQEKTFNITGEGNHTLTWRYAKNGWAAEGHDCGFVDYLQWTGGGPIPPPEPPEPPEPEWLTVSYTYDAAGRRIEKKVDGLTVAQYVYDGDHLIAEYGGIGLLRKYVYGPRVDEPICMTETVGDYAGTYYYHFDALGSVVALTDVDANAVQLYEYSVSGQVAASNPNHPNRFTFTGREFDRDTGLYYYRARYYNPEIGRYLQTDPMGYGDGMDLYAYCRNNGVNYADPSGLEYRFISESEGGTKGKLTWADVETSENGIRIMVIKDFDNLEQWEEWTKDEGAIYYPSGQISIASESWLGVKSIGGHWSGFTTMGAAALDASKIIANTCGDELQKIEFWYWVYSYVDPVDGVTKYGHTTIYKATKDHVPQRVQDYAALDVPVADGGVRVAGGHSHPAGGGEDFSGLPGSAYPGTRDYAWVNTNGFPLYLLTATGTVRVLLPGQNSSHYVGSVRVIR